MADIEIYIGDLIEHGSERAVIQAVVDILSDGNHPAIILANVNISGCQVDFVVAFDSLTLVIEAKSLFVPFHGGENGEWEVWTNSGWKPSRNYYAQTVRACHALRDAMSQFEGISVPYPSAALVFSSTIAQGSSDFRGNFKATIIELGDLHRVLRPGSTHLWAIENWRAFAKHHQLKKVENIAMAIDSGLLEARRVIDTYCAAFQRTYGPLADTLILNEDISCHLANVRTQGENGIGHLLCGPSGCGKSLMAYEIAVKEIDFQRIPIIFQAKEFDGDLCKMLNREIALLETSSAEALVAAAKKIDRPLKIIVDGYNECNQSQRSNLTRAIAAMCNRHEATVLITSQFKVERNELLQLSEIVVSQPDMELKTSIAMKASSTSLSDSQMILLNSVDSAFEAMLVGEIGKDIPSDASRYRIFDAYTRKRLDQYATEGIRALSVVAGFLSERVSFSLSIRDLERLAERNRISSDLLKRLQDAKFLVKSGDYVSFWHELYLHSFTAEATIRSSQDAKCIATAIQSPLHAEYKDLIIGAIDDDALITHVLSEISDGSAIHACLLGQCGPVARLWAEQRCQGIIRKMHDEISQVRFELDDKCWMKVKAASESLGSWTPQDQAILYALSLMFASGEFFEGILDTVKAMDDRLLVEYERLKEQAHAKAIGLRSGLFACCYCGFGGTSGSPAVSVICKLLDSGIICRKLLPNTVELIHEQLENESLSFGQLYLLLSLNRRGGVDAPSIARFLPGILRHHWRGATYHLRLCLMDAAGSSSWKISDEARCNLTSVIEELPATKNIVISTVMTETLKSLGALQKEEEGHVEDVRSMIRDILANQTDNNYRSLAFYVWSSQFDHIYDEAYDQAWSELSQDEKKKLLFMGGHHMDHENWFTSLLIAQLASFGDPSVVPVILRWTALPLTRCSMPQSAIDSFVMAHLALARLGCVLPQSYADDESNMSQVLRAVGKMIYWLDRIDLPMEQRKIECGKEFEILLRYELSVVAVVLSEVGNANCSFTEKVMVLPGRCASSSIGACFPENVAKICRQTLQQPKKQKDYFGFDSFEKMIIFSIASLGKWGNSIDLLLLRQWSCDLQFGEQAIKAIKKLEDKKLHQT